MAKRLCRFLLGRDKDPENSEVSRLIRQSVDQEQERIRAEQWQRAPSELTSSAERLAALKRLTGQVDGDEVDGEQVMTKCPLLTREYIYVCTFLLISCPEFINDKYG